MRRDRDRVLTLLFVAIAVESGIGLAMRAPPALGLVRGHTSAHNLLGAVALLWLVILLLVVRAALRLMRSLRSRVAHLTLSPHDWYWETDAALVLTHSNEAVTHLLGYRPGDLVGRSLFDLLPRERVTAAQSVVARARANGVGWQDTAAAWRHADGRQVRLVGNAMPVLDGGRVVGFRGWRRAPADTGLGASQREARSRVEGLLASQDLHVALQPITLLRTGGVVGFEALARFPDGRPPDVWFGEASAAGLRVELELLAVMRAQLLLPSALPSGAYLSVNASPDLVLDPRFSAVLGTVDVTRVVVEITEHVMVARYDELTSVLAPLRERGLRLAVDDAGAGYASFAHVLQLRPDVIKIDRSLVVLTPHDAAARALVVALTRLATEMDATVVAEGIEDQRELATLTVLAVPCGQGYHLGRPSTEPAQWAAWQRAEAG